MSDFHDFRNLARAAFSDLNVSVMMYEPQTARGGDLITYRLKANGPKLQQALTVEGPSAASAIDQMRSAIRFHRRGVETDEVLARLVKLNPNLTDEELDAARAELTACYLADFDKVTIKLLKAAEATAA